MIALPVLPSGVVILPLIAAFALLMVKYYIVNSANRVTDRHFLLGLGAVAAMMGYLVVANRDPADGAASCGFAVLAFAWLAAAWWLYRRKPAAPPPSLPFGTVRR